MKTATTEMVEIERIAIEDGFNPRSSFDQGELAELEASIAEHGVVSALTVRSDGNGGYVLIAGERRLRAAKLARLKEVPVLVRDEEGALAAAVAENLVRADLDPVETARALERLREAEKLDTQKELAARVGKSAPWVAERLRLLALPDGVLVAIASGAVPVAAEKDLRQVAAVSPSVAERLCELVLSGEIGGRELLDDFGAALMSVEGAGGDEQSMFVEVSRAVAIADLISDSERAEELAKRIEAASPYRVGAGGYLRFAEEDVDAARAAGCLLEHTSEEGNWSTTRQWICDAQFGADIAERIVERAEREARERAAERVTQSGEDDPGSDAEEGIDPEEAERRRRAKEREDAKHNAAIARTYNLSLGANLLKRRGAKSRRAHSLARARAVAKVLLADNESLAGAGLRLALPQLQEVEAKQLKSGETREKVTYRSATECAEYLANRVEEARSADEVLELLADALIAATHADADAVARSNRVNWWSGAGDEVMKVLAADVKAVRPRRPRKRG